MSAVLQSLPHPLVVAVEQIEGALGRMPAGAWEVLNLLLCGVWPSV
jgi:hypothetical protein